MKLIVQSGTVAPVHFIEPIQVASCKKWISLRTLPFCK